MNQMARYFAILLVCGSFIQTPQTRSSSIGGLVTRADTALPMEFARVELYSDDGTQEIAIGMTSADGRFEIQDVLPGRYRLIADANGFLRQEFGASSPTRPGTPVTVGLSQRLRNIDFKLIPIGVISGRVLDEDSKPLPGTVVEAMKTGYRDGERRLMAVKRTTADRSGEYRIEELPPGDYFISVTCQAASNRKVYVRTFYPRTTDPDMTSPLRLAAGSELSAIDFTLLPVSAYAARGHLDTAAPIQTGDVKFSLFRHDSRRLPPTVLERTGKVNAAGEFELKDIPAGTYDLFTALGTTTTARAMVTLQDKDAEGIRLRALPMASVRGTLQRVDRKPVSFENLVVSIAPTDNMPTGLGARSTTVTANNSFLIDNVLPGVYRLSFSGLPAEAFLVWPANLKEEAVFAGGRSVVLPLLVDSPGGRIEGAVQNEDRHAVAGARVVLVPEGRLRRALSLFKVSNSDQYGRFTFHGITPGTYKVFAWDEIEPGAHLNAEFLQNFETLGVPVEAEKGSSAMVHVKVVPR